MFCHKCGRQMPEGSVFCGGCGTKLVGETSKPNSSSPFSEVESNIPANLGGIGFGQPMGQPPINQPPMGQSMNQPPMGQPPMGQMNQPPMGQPLGAMGQMNQPPLQGYGQFAPQVILQKPMPAPKVRDEVGFPMAVACFFVPLLALIFYFMYPQAKKSRRVYGIVGIVSASLWVLYFVLMIIFMAVGYSTFYNPLV